MNRPVRRASHAAVTLMEVLACLGILAMILSAAGVGFSEIVCLRGAHGRYQQRVKKAEYLLRAIERDVRKARGFADSLGEFQSDGDTLILKVGEGHIVYRIESSTDGDKALHRVERTEFSGGKSTRQVIVPPSRLRVRFNIEDAPSSRIRCVVTTIDWEEHPKIGVSKPTLSLRLAPRNAGAQPGGAKL